MIELAQAWFRFGCRRLHILLHCKGVRANHKWVYRRYREAGLMVKR
ncbi:IS3 family transposase [Crenobacter oryzisoli]